MDRVPDGTEYVLKCVPKQIPAGAESVLEIEDKIKKRIFLYIYIIDLDIYKF